MAWRLGRRERLLDGQHILLALPEAQQARHLLQHVDAGPAPLPIDHDRNGPFGAQDAGERPETADRIRKVMQHPGHVDEVKVLGET